MWHLHYSVDQCSIFDTVGVCGMKGTQGAVLSKLKSTEVFNFLQLRVVAVFEA